MPDLTDYPEQIARDGYAIVEHAVSEAAVEDLAQAIAALPQSDAVRRKTNVYGIRNLIEECEPVAELACAAAIRGLVEPVLGEDSFAVRATFFDKVPDANWKLRWHQDSVIAVRERVETPGFTAWADKAGVQQVRPPAEILQRMLAIRVHLDDCGADNGPLRVLAGSHRQAWPREELDRCKEQFEERTCLVGRGGVVAMRPLLLHASGPAIEPAHRRVVHLEFAAGELPGELDWRTRCR
ncbi:Phytanoyl-CoA dioxygenase (PhyH) [Planctomycetes bacterium MalM25]|nr:Phytanoyl-CoA dioxygenase (PhyH) [Planctomycetes bacterium MalM25]